ncbi:hypothetical protein KEM48_010543 [Puccinia striiformis f. sp. tritici PST-130]|nr:hypothetical protein KEM48_010543 [Puccinia striiformis f. sp. tritici PST-130]
MYSRAWTTDKSEYVNNVILKVAKDHPNPPGKLNFNLMHALGPLASETKQKQPRDLHDDHDRPDADEPDESAPDDGQEFTLLESDFADLDEEEVILPELDLADLRPEDADALVTSQPLQPGKNKTLKSVTPTIAPKCKTPTTETAPHKNVRRKKVVLAAPLPEEPSISAPLMPNRPTTETIPKRHIRPNKVGIIKPQAKAPLVPPIAASSDALTIPTQPKKHIRPKKLGTIQPVAHAPIAPPIADPPLGDTMITVPVIPDALTLETQPKKTIRPKKLGIIKPPADVPVLDDPNLETRPKKRPRSNKMVPVNQAVKTPLLPNIDATIPTVDPPADTPLLHHIDSPENTSLLPNIESPEKTEGNQQEEPFVAPTSQLPKLLLRFKVTPPSRPTATATDSVPIQPPSPPPTGPSVLPVAVCRSKRQRGTA